MGFQEISSLNEEKKKKEEKERKEKKKRGAWMRVSSVELPRRGDLPRGDCITMLWQTALSHCPLARSAHEPTWVWATWATDFTSSPNRRKPPIIRQQQKGFSHSRLTLSALCPETFTQSGFFPPIKEEKEEIPEKIWFLPYVSDVVWGRPKK